MPDLFAAFRDPDALRAIAGSMALYNGRPLAFMEVCGTHTMAMMRFGIKGAMPPAIRLVSGPGCPVCVTGASYIDMAVELALRDGVILATFGDLMRVPGSRMSLMDCKARGADVRVVYSPLDTLALSKEHPDQRVVFLSVGFETTTPVVALTVRKAREQGIDNLLLLTANKTMPRALEALAADPELRIDGLILPGHVCTIAGSEFYEEFCARYAIPGVITGFEPLDMLLGIKALLAQSERGEARVENLYPRVAKYAGNPLAVAAVAEIFAPCDACWRGIGVIPASGLRLRDEYAAFDAQRVFHLADTPVPEPKGCLCSEILKGKRLPTECPLFGKACHPGAPVGACMVSSEGACAAYYQYQDSNIK
jgi:hydrogenase expression/formation protein HypD